MLLSLVKQIRKSSLEGTSMINNNYLIIIYYYYYIIIEKNGNVFHGLPLLSKMPASRWGHRVTRTRARVLE